MMSDCNDQWSEVRWTTDNEDRAIGRNVINLEVIYIYRIAINLISLINYVIIADSSSIDPSSAIQSNHSHETHLRTKH